MFNSKLLQICRCAAAMTALASTAALAQDALVVMVGDPAASHATIAFSPEKASADAIVISTRLAGVTGSRLAVRVDKSSRPVFEHLFAEGECRFVDQASICQTSIPGEAAAYGTMVEAFRRGLVAHVEVLTAGTMEMSQDASLRGFTRRYEGL